LFFKNFTKKSIFVILQSRLGKAREEKGTGSIPSFLPGKGTEIQRGQGEGMKIKRLGMMGKEVFEISFDYF
jgi:hypothetical protein